MSKKYSNHKDINAFVCEKLKEEGYRIRPSRKHDVLILPNNRRIAIPNSPSEHHAYQNFVHDVHKISLLPKQ